MFQTENNSFVLLSVSETGREQGDKNNKGCCDTNGHESVNVKLTVDMEGERRHGTISGVKV